MSTYGLSDVSVIIVNYNGESVVQDALESLYRLSEQPLEVVVVDNGSTDASLKIVRSFSETYRRLQLVEAQGNFGVAGGRNIGVEVAHGEVLAFLDADGRALDSWLPAALFAMNQDPRVGAVAPLVLMGNGDTINGAGSFIDASGHGRDRFWGESLTAREPDLKRLTGTRCDYPMGCGMVVRRPGLEQIWPLDEALLKWHDDTELGIRLRRLGYHTVFWPPSRVLHHPGHSDPARREVRHLESEMARFRLLLKYYPWPRLIGSLTHYLIHAISGARRHPERKQDAKRLLQDLRSAWPLARKIRRQWRQ